MFKKSIIFLLVFLFSVKFVYSACNEGKCDSPSEYASYRNQLEKQYNNAVNQKNLLSNQLKSIDAKYQLTLLKITQTEGSIATLEKEISGLSVEIGKLEKQIDSLSATYINQIIQSYKLQKKYPSFAYLFSDNINTFLEQHQYLSSIQSNSKQNLIDMEKIRYNYDTQKTTKENKQNELEELKKTLSGEKNNLNKQKTSKNYLLEVTKNDEKKYQQWLTEVQNKLSSLNNSSVGCLSSPQGGGSDGNFYSQIDPRWCTNFIGLQTKYTIGGAGCYLTSMSMVLKKIGTNINPAEYASDLSRFTSTADLAAPQVPAGYTYKKVIGYNSSIIDSELSNNRYIIAQVPMKGSPSGFHFITIISGSNGQYKMHDPVYGADKNFNDYYSTKSIISLRLITK